MSWKSCAEWPRGVLCGGETLTIDTHQTEEQAQGVVHMLKRDGFGGDGRVFPVRVWVEQAHAASEECTRTS